MIKQPKRTWGNLSGVQSPSINRVFGGVDQNEPFSIPEENGTDNRNVSTDYYPVLSTRTGFSIVGTALTNILGIDSWKEDELHVIANGEWFKWDGTAWVSLLTGLDTTEKWSFTNFQGNFSDINLLATNGITAKKYDGSTVTDLLNVPSGMNYIASHDNRVYGAVKNTVHFSALRKANDWTTVDDAGQIVVETPDGESISGLISGVGHVTIFKPSSIHELYGTSPLNYKMVEVSNEIGCESNESAKMIQGLLLFLGQDGIYQYAGGSLPKKISHKVQTFIDGITDRSKAVAGVYDSKYYLSIPYESTDNNITLEFDTETGTWNVWDIGNVTGFENFNHDLYFASDSIYKLEGETDNGNALTWNWITKPFSSGSLNARNVWFKLWLVVDCPTGSTMDIFVSADEKDWVNVKTISEDVNLQSQTVLLPVSQFANSRSIQVKIQGSGQGKVYELTRQERTLPL